jgi:hypothetical protein
MVEFHAIEVGALNVLIHQHKTIPVTHLPAGAMVRSDKAAPAPGYAPDAIHVFWETGSGFMRADEVQRT